MAKNPSRPQKEPCFSLDRRCSSFFLEELVLSVKGVLDFFRSGGLTSTLGQEKKTHIELKLNYKFKKILM